MDGPLRRTLLVVAVIATAAPVSAGFAATPGDAPAAASRQAPNLYGALTQKNPSSDVIAPLIEQAIRQAGFACAPLRDYQIFRVDAQSQTLKAKCAERPTYALTVASQGSIRVGGGDGTVQPMNPQDGPIVPVWGIRADRYLAQAAKTEAVAPQPAAAATTRHATAAGAIPALPAGQEWGPTLWAGLLLAVLLALPLLVWFNARPSEAQGFTSHDKDLLMEESQEILPEIYQHPEGWFIVRGRRGKRRVFRTLFFAYLYRRYGLKLGEVR